MDITTTIKSVLDKIPSAIGGVRDLITKLIGFLHLPVDGTFIIFAGILAVLLAYLFLKQFVLNSWAKFSTILNFILLVVIFYLIITYV
jgi:hypothetical protein